jgi:hypothetical protein
MGWIEPEIELISGDRRSKPRFELQLPVHYHVLNGKKQTGSGTTRNISSGGVAFEAVEKLDRGMYVELVINWPVALEGCAPMDLIARGCISWSEGGVVAVSITRTQFRSARRAAAAGGFRLP